MSENKGVDPAKLQLMKQELEAILDRNIDRSADRSADINAEDLLLEQEALLRDTVSKALALISCFYLLQAETQENFAGLQEKNHEIMENNQGLVDTLASMETKITILEGQNETAQLTLRESQEQLYSLEKQLTSQKKESQRLVLEAQTASACQYQAMEELYEQNERLREQLASCQKRIAGLIEENQQLRERVDNSVKLIQGTENRFEFEVKTKLLMESSLAESRGTISKLMGEIQELNETIRSTSQRGEPMTLNCGQFDEVDFHSELRSANRLNLCDQMHSKQGDQMDFNYYRRKDQDIERLEKIETIDQTIDKTIKKMAIDPYFAHFILTSQAVKIKEDCEELLNIDIKPFYGQIVDKHIPMHLWDQWIKNKLKEVLRKLQS